VVSTAKTTAKRPAASLHQRIHLEKDCQGLHVRRKMARQSRHARFEHQRIVFTVVKCRRRTVVGGENRGVSVFIRCLYLVTCRAGPAARLAMAACPSTRRGRTCANGASSGHPIGTFGARAGASSPTCMPRSMPPAAYTCLQGSRRPATCADSTRTVPRPAYCFSGAPRRDLGRLWMRSRSLGRHWVHQRHPTGRCWGATAKLYENRRWTSEIRRMLVGRECCSEKSLVAIYSLSSRRSSRYRQHRECHRGSESSAAIAGRTGDFSLPSEMICSAAIRLQIDRPYAGDREPKRLACWALCAAKKTVESRVPGRCA